MKLLIFGATGGTGKLVVQQALSNGHEVTAFVRNPEKLTLSDTGLRIVKGDILQPATIDSVMPGHDAVICCIGVPANKAFTLRSEGTKNIISAMKKHGVTRFICQTSLGYDDSEMILNNTPFIFRKIIVPFLLKPTFAEHSKQESYIKDSDLNWTIVRPGTMVNSALTGKYKHGFDYADKSVKVKIARADVAHFMLEQLSNKTYNKKAAGISY
jgi:putative NADH-flavin reductase